MTEKVSSFPATRVIRRGDRLAQTLRPSTAACIFLYGEVGL